MLRGTWLDTSIKNPMIHNSCKKHLQTNNSQNFNFMKVGLYWSIWNSTGETTLGEFQTLPHKNSQNSRKQTVLRACLYLQKPGADNFVFGKPEWHKKVAIVLFFAIINICKYNYGQLKLHPTCNLSAGQLSSNDPNRTLTSYNFQPEKFL